VIIPLLGAKVFAELLEATLKVLNKLKKPAYAVLKKLEVEITVNI
jgi:hypothetical protein